MDSYSLNCNIVVTPQYGTPEYNVRLVFDCPTDDKAAAQLHWNYLRACGRIQGDMDYAKWIIHLIKGMTDRM